MLIGILLFDDVDLLDSGGPYEVLLTANRLAERDGDPEPFRVLTVSRDGEPVTAYGGLRLIPHAAIGAVDTLSALIVPGAIAIDKVLADTGLIDGVRALTARTALTTSVCTGAFILADAGLLSDRAWTTHWEDIDLLAERIGEDGATRDVRWVDSGPVITSGGLSSGIAMTLHLVARLAGQELAERTARQIDYDWNSSGRR
jgi:transcriptional regulator GlxA family with amidase domain